MAESINFEGVGVAESTPRNYVTPGYRKLQFGTVEAISSTQKGTPGLQFNLVNETGGTLKTDFWLSAGALPRLQYLHKSLFGALLTKAMTPGELADYFNKNINGKKTYNFIVGGKKSGDKTYCELPYTNFIVPEGEEFTEGDFSSDDEKRYIRTSQEQAVVNSTHETVLSSNDIIIS